MRLTLTLFVAGLLLSRPSAEAQKFYPDDPIQRDNDTLDTPEKPAAIELGDLYDRVSHIGQRSRLLRDRQRGPKRQHFGRGPRQQLVYQSARGEPHESRRAQARRPTSGERQTPKRPGPSSKVRARA